MNRPVPTALGWAALATLALAVALFGIDARRLDPPAAAAPAAVQGPWAAYVAPASACPGGDDIGTSDADRQQTMLCLVNFARSRRSLAPVAPVPELAVAAAFKAREIVGCGRFEHDPCGTGAGAVFRRAGYGSGSARVANGENLALMTSEFASPRVILNGWLDSRGHRENLFRPDWTEQGVALLASVAVGDQSAVDVWVSHFGLRE